MILSLTHAFSLFLQNLKNSKTFLTTFWKKNLIVKLSSAKYLLIFCLSGCDLGRDADTIFLGTTNDNKPFEFMQDKKLVGLDIDIAMAIAKYLNRKLVIKNYHFHELLKALDKGEVDMVIAGLSVSNQRKNRVEFTVPYHSSQMVLMYRLDDPINRKEDLQDKKIGAQLGTVLSQVAKDLSNKYHTRIHASLENNSLVEHLKVKKVDAVVIEEEQASHFMENDANLGTLVLDKKKSEFAVAITLNSELKSEIMGAMFILTSNGVIDALKKKWLAK